jgi:hypothetical protein
LLVRPPQYRACLPRLAVKPPSPRILSWLLIDAEITHFRTTLSSPESWASCYLRAWPIVANSPLSDWDLCARAKKSDAPIALRQIRTPTSTNHAHRDCPAVTVGTRAGEGVNTNIPVIEIFVLLQFRHSGADWNLLQFEPGTSVSRALYHVRSQGRIFRCGRA